MYKCWKFVLFLTITNLETHSFGSTNFKSSYAPAAWLSGIKAPANSAQNCASWTSTCGMDAGSFCVISFLHLTIIYICVCVYFYIIIYKCVVIIYIYICVSYIYVYYVYKYIYIYVCIFNIYTCILYLFIYLFIYLFVYLLISKHIIFDMYV